MGSPSRAGGVGSGGFAWLWKDVDPLGLDWRCLKIVVGRSFSCGFGGFSTVSPDHQVV